ncbi:SH3 domain-containing protein [Vacuolonema iberomarrocanum]|uniref:SH3 domain-containing protein n=1 Tax=Vacuolonema iberomarrocanum TaxID=3454632 RepID=UPI001A0A70EF|nr:SH3 domain-containing protein [filamentous cyanobacterium LEGE 07170]
MRLPKAFLAILILGLTACQLPDDGSASALNANESPSPTSTEAIPLPAAQEQIESDPQPEPIAPDEAAPSAESTSPSSPEEQAAVPSNQPTPNNAQRAGWGTGDNVRERCGVLLAYDPNDTSVNLRDRPNGDVMDSLPNLTPLSSQDGLAYIDPDVWNPVVVQRTSGLGSTGQSGYIWHELLRRTYYQVEDTQDTYANLRQSPGGTVIDTVPNGTEVRFMGEVDVWTQVELASGQTGYVATALLTEPRCF